MARARPPLLLGILAALSVVHGLLWVLVVPPWQNPDEPKHLEYVRLLAARGDALAFATEDEAADPALQRAILDSMDRHGFWWFGRAPGYAPGAGVPERFRDVWPLGTHTAYYRASPAWYWLAARAQPAGLEAGLYAARLLSVVLGAGVVLATGAAARALFPADPLARYGAPALVALHPMVAAVHASASPDALVDLAAAVAWLLACLVLARGASASRLGLLAAAALAAVLVKRSALALWPALGLAAAWAALHGGRRRLAALAAFAAALGVAAWLAWSGAGTEARWTVLRYLFNEPDQPARILAVLRAPEARPLLAAYLRRIHDGFWGVFGWEAVRYPAAVYGALLAVGAAAALGAGRRALRGDLDAAQRGGLAAAAAGIAGVAGAATAFFAAYLATPYAQPPQGRYLVIAAPMIALGLAAGLGGWLPERLRARAAAVLVGALALADAAILLGLVAPYFRWG